MIGLYLAFDSMFRRVCSVLVAWHQGVWLGLFDSASLEKITRRQYAQSQKYHDLEYNRSGLRSWENEALHRYFSAKSSILVGAAGGGREVVALRKLGYRADGFDCVDGLVNSARALLGAENIDCRMELAEPGTVPGGFGKYYGIIIGWGGYMHIPGRMQRINFLKQLHKHAIPHAPILLSFFTRAKSSRKFVLIYWVAVVIRKLRFSSETVQIGDTLDGTFDHYFTQSEIRSELQEAGFELIVYSESDYGHAIAAAVDWN